MYKNPTVGDVVENTHTYEPAKVIEVNERHGWFKVEYLTGIVKEHSFGSRRGCSSFVKLSSEQKADLYLKLENAGITDVWRED